MGGCSASFVSPQGLVATNHHCVFESIQYHSKEARTISQTAFWRRALGEELPAAPGSRIHVIEDMRDVTAEILKGVSDKLNGFARYERLATNRKALIAACEGQPNRRCDVGAYYGGVLMAAAGVATEEESCDDER
ncbi:S46 family peptidase [Mesorhizobium sp. M0114]|uniref:S46 family peptidase n=1 Tax=Mesorhizobium sp. M0114 TaxID=2956882 RepID=UPI00333A35DF